MKPVAIFQHTEVGAPGSVPAILNALGIPYRLIPIVDGAPVPARADAFSGLIFMGGYMSVHDPLPWLAQEMSLIRQAADSRIPLSGHCLGSQIMAVALGGEVSRNPRPEIGWQPITVTGAPAAADWLSRPAGHELLTFQWHGDTFHRLPEGAELIATSAHCLHQGFVLDGIHIAMQSHLEMTPALVRLSVARNGQQLDRELAAGNPAVTSRADTLAALDAKTAALHDTLAPLYAHWARNLQP
ncbi:type 1 glutamine amidotransferase [Kerstersia similis]|uniref:type 1 glutamine amidotransferase n=1 Tax=Kerstersia similis TaxID=206505 RepID=UPI0039EF1EFA